MILWLSFQFVTCFVVCIVYNALVSLLMYVVKNAWMLGKFKVLVNSAN